MRKNHHGKKDRLVKRVFALCLALAVICTCLVPVFATEYKDVVDSGEEEIAGFGGDEAAYPDDEVAGFGGDEAAYPDEREVVDYSGEEEATRPVEGGEDNLDGGPNVKETEWGTVIEYGPSSSTGTDPEPETQWSGEDDVVAKPDDKVVVSGDEIKKLQDMVVYRFWLKELNANDLQDITAQAQINNMTESEYLARNGEVLWNLYFIQAVPRAETIADYSSYIENPSSNRDPKGELRQFDYWYTLDEFGNRVRLNLTDPTSNILDDKTTTVNVYAAWKDGTVGSDEEEDVDHEDLVDKNPVPVDLTAKAAASYEDEEGNTKSVNLPVEVKNLPSATHRLSVTHMGDNSMTEFCNTYVNELQGMQPLLGLKITPEDINSEKVHLAKGQKATVTVSGLNELPDIAEMEEAGALTADALKVLHQKDDNTVEKLDVVSYENGTLTFETSSFSPFVIALAGGYDTELLDERAANKDPINLGTINVGDTKPIEGYNKRKSSNHRWETSNNLVATVTPVTGNNGKATGKATIIGVGNGEATITHTYYYDGDPIYKAGDYTDIWTVNVRDWKEEAGLYILCNLDKSADSNDTDVWTGVVQVNNEHAKLGDLTDAKDKWTNSTTGSGRSQNILFASIGGPGSDTAKKYIKYWPDKVAYDGPRTLKPCVASDPDYDFRTTAVKYKGKDSPLENVIFDVYKETLVKLYTDKGFDQQKVADLVEGLGPEKITFTITPHKISRNNNQTPDKHIDCTITVAYDLTFTAVFNAKDSNGNSYTSVDRKVYLWDDENKDNNTVTKCETNPGEFTDKDGVTWVFDGWCLEDVHTGNEPGENAPVISDAEWRNYIVNENVLTNGGGDRVVNFYAHYRKKTSNVTITKEVKGLLGDTTNPFNFSVSIKQNGVDCTGVTATKGSETVKDLTNFTLKHNEFVTLENVPVGAIIEVTETAPGEHYKVSATGHKAEQNGSGPVTFTYVAVANTPTTGGANEANLTLLSVDEDTAVGDDGEAVAYDTGAEVTNNQITVINRCDLMPDTGVLLDTLPYIVILAVVAGGVALLMLRKRRKEDD